MNLTEDLQNPFTRTDIYQELYFSIFPTGDRDYNFRFIDVTKAKTISRDKFDYVIFTVVAQENNKGINVIKGDIFMLHLPYHSFVNALKGHPYSKHTYRREQEIDLQITFRRRSKKAIDIVKLDTIDMSIYADEIKKKQLRGIKVYTPEQ